jgi:hypothetical protein
MLDRRAVELVLISLLAAFCGGLAWALDHELFAVALPQLRLWELSVLWPLGWARAGHRQTETALLAIARARPPATTRAIQLTHIGIDQSPMMTVHSMKIRTRWNNATTAKITPATRENVFASMSHHPRFGGLRQRPLAGWKPPGDKYIDMLLTAADRKERITRIQRSIAELSALTKSDDNK